MHTDDDKSSELSRLRTQNDDAAQRHATPRQRLGSNSFAGEPQTNAESMRWYGRKKGDSCTQRWISICSKSGAVFIMWNEEKKDGAVRSIWIGLQGSGLEGLLAENIDNIRHNVVF